MRMQGSKAWLTGEIIIAFSIFIGALLLRFQFLNRSWLGVAGDQQLYQLARDVVSNPLPALTLPDGIAGMYTLVLSFVMRMTGQELIAAVGMQFVLQSLSLMIIYPAVRNMAGRAAALATAATVAFSNGIIRNLAYVNAESFLLFLLTLILFFLSLHIKSWQKAKRSPAFYSLFTVICALLTGAALSLDGVFLCMIPVMMAGLVCGQKQNRRVSAAWGQFFLWLPVTAAVFIVSLVLQSRMTMGSIVQSGIKQWAAYTISGIGAFLRESLLLNHACSIPVLLLYSAFLVCMIRKSRGVAARLKKEYHQNTVHEKEDSFVVKDITESEEELDLMVAKEENGPKAEPEENSEVKKVKLIHNPLPGPKKHVKKELNYRFNPEAEEMNFDYEITSDHDDYDI